MRTAWPGVLVLACLLITGAGALAGGRHQARSTPELLLDLARDHGLNCRGTQTAADVQHIQTLLRAATRLDPRLSGAHVWLHELAMLRGQPPEAAATVRGLVAADPKHVGALACWLEVALDTSHTAEQRVTWLEAQLAAGTRPEFAAMIHVQLARLGLARLDLDQARRHVDTALAADPCSGEAVALKLQLLDEDTPPDRRLRVALRFLQLSPLHVDTAWQVGMLLDEYGFHEEAERFYQHALDVHRRGGAGTALPGLYLLKFSQHALARGQPEQAVLHATEAIVADPALAAQAGMFLHWLLERQGRTAEADGVREQLGRRFAKVREPREWPVDEVAQAAWFYCTIDPQPQRALMLAQAAAAQAPGDAFVARVLGWAQVANLQEEQAERTLLPIAGKDPYAAYQLARLLKAGGHQEAARRVLDELTPLPTAGPARELLSELDPGAVSTQPAARRHVEIVAALSTFDHDVLEFHRDPARFLNATITPEDRSPNPGEPWWVQFTLTNRGRFPITLGPEWMVNPVFLLSFELEGDRQRTYPHLMTINLDRVRVIPPGATVKIRRTIDVGPLRRVSRATPQQLQRITVRAILDPVHGPDGKWRPSLGGQTLRPAYFNRLPAATGREALHALFGALGGSSGPAGFRAVEVMSQLLGEQQRAELRPLSYRPQPIPAARLRQALLASLSSDSWELRARTLDALQVAGLDAEMLKTIESCLEHSHWLVRLMAVRLLGARQGEAAAPTLQNLAREDVDELVRALAGSYLTAWEHTATRLGQ